MGHISCVVVTTDPGSSPPQTRPTALDTDPNPGEPRHQSGNPADLFCSSLEDSVSLKIELLENKFWKNYEKIQSL